MDVGKNDWRSSVFFHPTSRANIGDAVSILHSSEEERLEITSNITGSWQGKLRNQYLKCFKVLNRKKVYLLPTIFFIKKYLKILHTYMHTKNILVIFAHDFWLPVCSWKYISLLNSCPLFFITHLIQLVLPTCTWMWCHPLKHMQSSNGQCLQIKMTLPTH